VCIANYERLQRCAANVNSAIIQRRWRIHRAYKDRKLAVASATYLQSLVRRRLTVRMYRLAKSGGGDATATVRSILKSYAHSRCKIAPHVAETPFSRLFRLFLTATSREHVVKVLSATTIQCCFRMSTAVRVKRRIVSNTIKLQSAFRRHLTILRVNELRFITKVAPPVTISVFRRHFLVLRINALQEFRAKYERENITRPACIALQKWWRNVLLQRKLVELEAAATIQKCYRGSQGFLLFTLKNRSAIRIQACVRVHPAKCILQRLKQEKQERMERERIALENAAATAIQSSFRGYRDFVRFVWKMFSVIHIQTIARGYLARCCHRIDPCKVLRRLEVLKQEKRSLLQNVASTAIVSRIGQADISSCWTTLHPLID